MAEKRRKQSLRKPEMSTRNLNIRTIRYHYSPDFREVDAYVAWKKGAPQSPVAIAVVWLDEDVRSQILAMQYRSGCFNYYLELGQFLVREKSRVELVDATKPLLGIFDAFFEDLPDVG